MGFSTFDLGIHKEIPIALFGIGDVGVTTASHVGYALDMVLFHHWAEARGVGAPNPEIQTGMTTDTIPKPNLVFKFGNPESVQVVIDALIEVRDSLKSHLTA